MESNHRWRWLAAEFTIIALGVLSALIVDTWIDEREEAQRSAVYRERLIRDLEVDVRDMKRHAAYYARIRRFGQITLEDLEGTKPLSDFALVFAAFNAAEEWGWQPQSSTFDDLRSTGALALIDDVELRLDVSHYYSTAETRKSVWQLPRAYRESARGIIPNSLQKAIHDRCTAIPDDIASAGMPERPNGGMIPAVLDPDSLTNPEPDFCGIDPAVYDLAAAAAELRADARLLRELRFRISELRVSIGLFRGQMEIAEELLERLRDQ